MPLNSHVRFWLPGWMPSEPPLPTRIRWAPRVRPRGPVMRGASLERASHGSLLSSLAFEALHDRGTTRGPTIPRQGSGRRVSVRLAVTRPVIAGDHSRHLSETVKQRATGKRLVAPSRDGAPRSSEITTTQFAKGRVAYP